MELGGIETMLINISNEQVRLGHNVSIIVINDIVNEELLRKFDEKINVYRINRAQKSLNPFVYIRLNQTIRKTRPDIIHLHQPSIIRYIFGKKIRSKICVTLHDVCKIWSFKYLSKCGPIIAISKIVKDDILKTTGLPSQVIPNGINTNIVKEKIQNAHSQSIFNIVQVSRLQHSKKGQDILIHAAKSLKERGIDNFHITFIGDGESKEYLQTLVQELNLTKNITFLGSKSQEYVLSHLADYDLLVQPSRYEGFGLTVAEGMAAKLPVIVTEDQGPAEVIEYGKYGFTFENGNAESLADKIEKIIKEGVSDKLISEAYDHVKNNYSVETTASKYIEFYKEHFINNK